MMDDLGIQIRCVIDPMFKFFHGLIESMSSGFKCRTCKINASYASDADLDRLIEEHAGHDFDIIG